MNPPVDPTLGIRTVFHPSDFSEASQIAFAHALKIALIAQCKLDIMHVDIDHRTEWEDFPGVRPLLEKWKLIPAGSDRDAVLNLGLNVHKAIVERRDPVSGTLEYLESHPADLIVLAVLHHEGRMRWISRSVGEPIAKKTGEATLFLPHGIAGFVSVEDGSVSLNHILIPVANKPSPQPSLRAVAALVRGLQLEQGTVTLLHVGSEDSLPSLEIPSDTQWDWQIKVVEGSAVDTIVEQSQSLKTDLIVMTTDGPDGFLDGLRGSHSERVLRAIHCPLAVIPEGARLSANE
ncbi:MAG: universal stress protein [Planctomycetota bacterium]